MTPVTGAFGGPPPAETAPSSPITTTVTATTITTTPTVTAVAPPTRVPSATPTQTPTPRPGAPHTDPLADPIPHAYLDTYSHQRANCSGEHRWEHPLHPSLSGRQPDHWFAQSGGYRATLARPG
ncbi:MAG: hypothetical protein IPL78_09265 [Chloroflexi bacterium]|nr:hypothetical protein [Chloroflexota bacterium]